VHAVLFSHGYRWCLIRQSLANRPSSLLIRTQGHTHHAGVVASADTELSPALTWVNSTDQSHWPIFDHLPRVDIKSRPKHGQQHWNKDPRRYLCRTTAPYPPPTLFGFYHLAREFSRSPPHTLTALQAGTVCYACANQKAPRALISRTISLQARPKRPWGPGPQLQGLRDRKKKEPDGFHTKQRPGQPVSSDRRVSLTTRALAPLSGNRRRRHYGKRVLKALPIDSLPGGQLRSVFKELPPNGSEPLR